MKSSKVECVRCGLPVDRSDPTEGWTKMTTEWHIYVSNGEEKRIPRKTKYLCGLCTLMVEEDIAKARREKAEREASA
jgi:hypothetical protein